MLKTQSSVKSRVFIVGCPRSGTTLLQVLLASHPDIISFPESHFFTNLYPKHEPRRKLLNLGSRRAKPNLYKFLESANVPDFKSFIYPWTLFIPQYINCFVSALDSLACEQDKSIWIEKTPDHLHYIGDIERSVKNVKFIHIVRNGLDVIASLYEVTRKYPQAWHGPWSIDRCVNHWIQAIEISRGSMQKSNHILITYEELSNQSNLTLKRLFDFLGIDFESEALTQSGIKASSFVLDTELWKTSATQKIHYSKGVTYKQIFSTIQKKYIEDMLILKQREELFSTLVLP